MYPGANAVVAGALRLPDCHGRPVCDPTPVCPACGGLECLCRPRFFAGQLLTEEDLNRLDHYIQGKNRLHNRFLHGWGVACGLEVVCGVCGPDQGHVTVKPGYALSPCGNDIIVCKTESVDVCDLINRCRPPLDDCHDVFAQPQPPPDPQHDPAVPGRGPLPGDRFEECGGTEDWVLAICYVEKPTRGVAALRATIPDPDCGCGGGGKGGCGCGGNGSKGHGSSHAAGCGCGCGGHAHGASGRKKSQQAATRTLPEQCEPTVTCEGYRFVAYKLPKKNPNEQQFGAAQRRFLCCIAPLIRELGTGPGLFQNPQQGQAWVIAFRDAVREFVLTEGLYDCQIAEKLTAVAIPSVAGQAPGEALAALNQSALSIADIAGLAWQKCFCAALLPPCPEPSQTDCVPLATITVARGHCRVLRICNIAARKFLVTWPNIGYWLSFVVSENPLREFLEEICCRFDPGDWKLDGVNFFAKAEARQARRAAAPKTPGSPAASLFWRSVTEPARTVRPEQLLLGALNARDARGRPFVTDEELAHPSEFLLFNDVVAPLIRKLLPEELPFAGVPRPADRARMDDLAEEISSLKATVDKQQKTMTRQQKTIDELKRRR